MLRTSVGILALLVLAVACELPTEAPKWEQTWVVPGEEISVSVAELLPTGIDTATTGSGTVFVTNAPGASVQFSLATMCGATCDPIDGLSGVPKPAFSDTITTTSSLPSDLVTATLSGGALSATMAHDFNFDPLRPTASGTPTGYLVIRVTSNGNLVAFDSIDGADTAFPGGTSLTRTLDIMPATVSNTLNIEIALVSPDGDNTTIETSDTLGVTVAESTIEIAEATVTATGITLDPTTTTMDFGGVDSVLVERIQSGALRFDITNPFSVTGTLDVTFQGITPSIQPKTLTLQQGTYEDRLDFTGEELQAILGADAVDVSTAGSISATGGTVTVTPTQVLTLDNEFELVVLIGPTEDL